MKYVQTSLFPEMEKEITKEEKDSTAAEAKRQREKARYWSNPEHHRERKRKYYAEHREELKARQRVWYVNHLDAERKRCRKYYRLNSDVLLDRWQEKFGDEYNREACRKYYWRHREEILARRKKQSVQMKITDIES